MAVDPRIALGARAANIGDMVMNFADSMERSKLAERQLGVQEQAAKGQAEANRLRAETARQKLEQQGKLQAAQEAASFTAGLVPMVRQDPMQAVPLLQKRAAELQAQGRDASDTLRQIELAQSDPKAFAADVMRDNAVAVRMGLMKEEPEQFTTEYRNGVPVQVSSRSNRAVADPSTPPKLTATERSLGALASTMAADRAALGAERVRAARLANSKSEREAQASKRTKELEDVNKLRDAKAAIEASKPRIADLNESIDNAIRLAEQWGTTGTTGEILAKASGTDAADLRAELETIGSTVTLDELAGAKKRGITFGALSEGEVNLVGRGAGNLSTKQSQGQIVRNLRRIRARNDRIAEKLEQHYKEVLSDLKVNPAKPEMSAEEQILRQGAGEIQVGPFKVTVTE